LAVNNEVGDGTTSTAILAAEMLRLGHKYIIAGMDPNQMVRGMQSALEECYNLLADLYQPISTQEDLERVAFIASNGDVEVAKNLAEACMAVGNNGTVTIEDGQSIEVLLELKEGMEIDRGAYSLEFLGSDTERTLEGPLVAVVNASLSKLEDVQDLLETASQWPQNELIVFCKSIVGDALSTMVLNNKEQIVRCCAVQAPGISYRQSDYLEDIAAISGATFVDPGAGFSFGSWDSEWFGSLRKAVIKQKSSVLLAYDEITDNLEEHLLKLKATEAMSSSEYDRDKLKERISKLTGGLAVLKVGAATEVELKERRARVEDALGSVKAALKDGVVPGAGSAYWYLGQKLMEKNTELDSFSVGWTVVAQSLKLPICKLLANAGYLEPPLEKLNLQTPWVGWDIAQLKIRNLWEQPCIADPTAVVASAIRSAISVAATLLTVEVSITKE
jgi:chaperonin GroEL